MVPRDEGQNPALALNRQTVRIRNDLNRIYRPAGKAIDRAKHMERAHKVEFINRRNDDDDDPAA
jgi:hypothetical protein